MPPEIEAEFLTVLARLQSGAPATTATTATTLPATTVADPNVTEPTTLFADEGYDPDEDPALRVNEYVQFACRDAINNPGPAATQPGHDRRDRRSSVRRCRRRRCRGGRGAGHGC